MSRSPLPAAGARNVVGGRRRLRRRLDALDLCGSEFGHTHSSSSTFRSHTSPLYSTPSLFSHPFSFAWSIPYNHDERRTDSVLEPEGVQAR